MNDETIPLLYSYRRCPFAMRARMALHQAGVTIQTIDISLRDKPEQLLAISPKGTVPVLQLTDGVVLEESLDIMRWALSQSDPAGWLRGLGMPNAQWLLQQNDGVFKSALDRYKYASRFPDADPLASRHEAMRVLIEPLAQTLEQNRFIGGSQPVLQDIAIFPFVRQFAGVDSDWFNAEVPVSVARWLSHWVGSDLFLTIMKKQPRLAD